LNGRARARAVAACLALVASTTANAALAQATPPPAPAAPPKRDAATPATTPAPTPELATASGVTDLTAPVPGGVTAEQVAIRAMQTSYAVKASQETLASQQARIDQAEANWYPRVGLKGSYTRLSEFTPPSFGSGGSIVVTPQPAGTLNPTPTLAAGFSFPVILNQYLLQATLAVPISDYFLRIGQAATSVSRQEEAARHDLVAAKAKSYSDGKVAYFTWMRARGAITVTQQALVVARAHLKDAENQFAVGNASKADVLRAQTQVAAAELGVERAKNGATLAERNVRVAMHLEEGAQLDPGDPLEANLSPAGDMKALVAEAHGARAEIKSIDKNAEAIRKSVTVSRNGRLPQLSAFGQLDYANPNQRRQPQAEEWFPTWAVGAQVTWTPNDYLVANGAAAELEARASSLEAQRLAVRDGIELEVVQAYQDVLTADAAIVSTTRQIESAQEGYRVARELFNNGRGTGTTVIDSENALAQTRFDFLNARVDARLARVRLEHAAGRDTRAAGAAAAPSTPP
jgi:outer membrane protein TolC